MTGLNSSALINDCHCTESVVRKRIKFNHISQMTVYATNHGETGRLGAPLISSYSYCRNCPVRKFADTEGGQGDPPNQNPNNAAGDGEAENGAAGAPVERNGGNNNGDGQSSSSSVATDGDDGDGGYGDGSHDPFKVKIHLYDANFALIETINTDVYAYQYSSWNSFARVILEIWMQRNMSLDDLPYDIPEVVPSLCWPGCAIAFGHIDEEDGLYYQYDWREFEWDDVFGLIKDILVLHVQ